MEKFNEFFNYYKKHFLNPIFLLPVVIILGILYGLTDWVPLLWACGIAGTPLLVITLIGIIYVWIIKPIKWLIKKIKK